MIDPKEKQRFHYLHSMWLLLIIQVDSFSSSPAWRVSAWRDFVSLFSYVYPPQFIHFALNKNEIRKIIENNFSRFVYGWLRVRSGEMVFTQIVFPSIGARKNRFSIPYNSFISSSFLTTRSFYLNHLIINIQPHKIYVIAPIFLSVYSLIQLPKQLPRCCSSLSLPYPTHDYSFYIFVNRQVCVSFESSSCNAIMKNKHLIDLQLASTSLIAYLASWMSS